MANTVYEEIRKKIENTPVVGTDETGSSIKKELHWNWIIQNSTLTYVFQMKSRRIRSA